MILECIVNRGEILGQNISPRLFFLQDSIGNFSQSLSTGSVFVYNIRWNVIFTVARLKKPPRNSPR